MYADSSWGTIDEPAWNHGDDRCSRFSRKIMIVFRQVGAGWQVVTVTREFGHFGSCGVRGVPKTVSNNLPLC